MREQTVSVERDDRYSVLIRLTRLVWFPDHREIMRKSVISRLRVYSGPAHHLRQRVGQAHHTFILRRENRKACAVTNERRLEVR